MWEANNTNGSRAYLIICNRTQFYSHTFWLSISNNGQWNFHKTIYFNNYNSEYKHEVLVCNYVFKVM